MSANNYCSNCGESLKKGVNFCPNCGHKINNEQKYNNKETQDESKDWSYEEVVNNNKSFPKFWGHLIIGLFSIVLMVVGFLFFEELMRGAFGYYTPSIVEIAGSILIGFLIASVLVLVIAVYAIKLNLLIYDKDSITWNDILLKNINFSEKIMSFIGAYFLVVLINFAIILAAFFLTFLASENYYTDLARMIPFISGIILLIINSRLVLSQFIVFDKKQRAVASLKKSFELTKGNTFKLIGWLILISIINTIGGSTILGVLLSFPVTVFILTRVYYNLEY